MHSSAHYTRYGSNNSLIRTALSAISAALVLSLLATGAWSPARAQSTAAPAQPAASEQHPAQAATQAAPAKKSSALSPQRHLKIGPVVVSGSLRGRSETWTYFPTPGYTDSYTFGAMTLRVALSQQTKRLDWFVDAEVPVLMGLPHHAIAPAPKGQLGAGGTYFAASGLQDASVVPKQFYVRLKAIGGDGPSSLRLGRFEFAEGLEVMPKNAVLATLKRERIAQRLIGFFGFTHVMRSFDGVQYVRDTAKNNFTLFGARPTEGVFQLRGTNELDTDLSYGAWTRQLAVHSAPSEARLFGIYYHDGRRLAKADNRPVALINADHEKIRIATLGGHWISAIPAHGGTVDLLAWGAAQFGSWGNLSHRAGALAMEGGYQFGAKWKPWVRGGFFWSSGDGNPTDGNHNTFFQILPTTRIYARFPIFNLMNLEDVSGEFRLKPHPKLSLHTDVRYLRLSNSADLWYGGGGGFQQNSFGFAGRPSGGNSGLGTLVDFSADVSVTRWTTLTFYAGSLRGGSVPAYIYPATSPHPGAQFFYLEFLQTF